MALPLPQEKAAIVTSFKYLFFQHPFRGVKKETVKTILIKAIYIGVIFFTPFTTRSCVWAHLVCSVVVPIYFGFGFKSDPFPNMSFEVSISTCFFSSNVWPSIDRETFGTIVFISSKWPKKSSNFNQSVYGFPALPPLSPSNKINR